VNVYQNETMNLILRKHAVKREEHAMPYHHTYNTESKPHFNSILICNNSSDRIRWYLVF